MIEIYTSNVVSDDRINRQYQNCRSDKSQLDQLQFDQLLDTLIEELTNYKDFHSISVFANIIDN